MTWAKSDVCRAQFGEIGDVGDEEGDATVAKLLAAAGRMRQAVGEPSDAVVVAARPMAAALLAAVLAELVHVPIVDT